MSQLNDFSKFLSKNFKKNQKKRENIQIGDQIFIKFMYPYTESLYGILESDGIINNSLSVLEITDKNIKAARKSIFQIETHEFEENKGKPLIYGQIIRLRHIFSNKMLRMKSQIMKKSGDFEIGLEFKCDEEGDFLLISKENRVKNGEIIRYSDKILICSELDNDYYINIDFSSFDGSLKKKENSKIIKSLENTIIVSMSINSTEFQFKNYLEQDFPKNMNQIPNSSMISLYNSDSDAFLSINSDFDYKISVKENKVMIGNFEESDKYMNSSSISIVNMGFLDPNLLQKTLESTEIEVKTSQNTQILQFWEIQRLNPLNGEPLYSNEPISLRNISIGLYLTMDFKANKLILTRKIEDNQDKTSLFLLENKENTNGFDQNNDITNDLGQIKVADMHDLVQTKGTIHELNQTKSKIHDFKNVLIRVNQSDLYIKIKDNLVKTSKSPRNYEISQYCFEINIVKETQIIDQFISINEYLINFHYIAQSYGILIENANKTNEITIKYKNEICLEQIYTISIWIDYFEIILKLFSEHLSWKIEKTELKSRQNMIKELKISDFLLMIARLLDSKIYGNKNSKEYSEKFNKKIEITPIMEISFNIFNKVMKIMYTYLGLLLTSDDSSILNWNMEFLTYQIRVYPLEILKLLKEIFTKYKDFKGTPQLIIDFIGLLESLNENSNNIEIQIALLDLISLILNGLYWKECQTKLIQELFSYRGGNEMKKALIRFAFKEEKSIIIFKLDSKLADFLAINPSLSILPTVKLKENEETASFYLKDLYKLENSLISRYISSFLLMLCNLTSERNIKNISKIIALGLSSQHILYCLKSDFLDFQLKSSYLLLFSALFLDKEPFISIQSYSNRCIKWNEIENFSIENPICYILNNEDLDSPEGGKVQNPELLKFIDIFIDFWNFGEKFLDFEKEFKEKIVFSITFFKISKKIIDLGYTNQNQNLQVFQSIIMIFNCFNQEKIDHEHWLAKFTIKIMEESIENEEINELYSIFMYEISGFFEIFKEIRINLQINKFCLLLKSNFTDFSNLVDFSKLYSVFEKDENQWNSIQIMLLNYLVFDLKSKYLNSKEILKNVYLKSNKKTNKIFFPEFTLEKIINFMKYFLDENNYLLKELENIVLIDGEELLQMYRELDCNKSVKEEVLNPKRLKLHIDRLLEEVKSSEKPFFNDNSEKINKITELTHVINRVNSNFKKKKGNKRLFSKMQNILRNFKIHDLIFPLLLIKIDMKNTLENNFFQNILNFFEFFIENNQINQYWILNKIPYFINLLDQMCKVAKVMSFSMNSLKITDGIFAKIELIFEKLEEISAKNTKKPKNEQKFSGKELLRLLQSLIFDEKNQILPLNQRKILNLLLKSENLIRFTLKSEYLQKSEKLIEKYRTFERSKGAIHNSLFQHIELMHLLSKLAYKSKFGMVQLKKLFVYEQLKKLLIDKNLVFSLKKPYLRCFFNVYFLQIEELNSDLNPNEFQDFLKLIIYEDLLIYRKFFGGILKKSSNLIEDRQILIEKLNKLQPNEIIFEKNQISHKKTAGLIQILSQNDTNRTIKDISEYWKYLYGGPNWISQKDGILKILSECLDELKKRDWLNMEKIEEILLKIREKLEKIKESLNLLEKENEKKSENLEIKEYLPHFSSYKYHIIIDECLKKLPMVSIFRVNTRKTKEKDNNSAEIQQILQKITINFIEKTCDLLQKRKITYENFVEMFGFFSSLVYKDEFIDKMHRINKYLTSNGLENECLSKEEISNFSENFKKKGNLFNFKKFLKRIRVSLEKRRSLYDKEALKNDKMVPLEIDESELSIQKEKSLKKSIEKFKNLYIYKDKYLVQRKFIRLLLLSLKNHYKNSNYLSNFLRKWCELFVKFSNSTEIFRLFSLFLEESIDINFDLEFLQEKFWESGVIEFALSNINKGKKLEEIDCSLVFLINCLKNGNSNIQNLILSSLKYGKKEFTSDFFVFLKKNLTYQQDFEDKTVDFEIFLIHLMDFLSSLCCNLNSEFKNYLRKPLENSNIVYITSELLSFLVFPYNLQLIEGILSALLEYSLGPCNENQWILSSNKRLLLFINDVILKENLDIWSEDPKNLTKIKLFSMGIKFLLTLSYGNTKKNSIINLLLILDIQEVLFKLQLIFSELVQNNKNLILREEPIFLTPFFKNVLSAGFNIFILLTIFKDFCPSHPKLSYFNENLYFDKEKFVDLVKKFRIGKNGENPFKMKKNKIVPFNNQIPDEKIRFSFTKLPEIYNKNPEIPGLEDEIRTSLSLSFQEEEIGQKRDIKEINKIFFIRNLRNCLLFYKGLIGTVEILKDEQISKIYFQKPYISVFLTNNIRENLIYKADFSTNQTRLGHLVRNVRKYEIEMEYHQGISRLKLMHFFVKSWRKMKDFSFFLIIFINFFSIFNYDKNQNGENSSFSEINQAITIVQLVLGVFILVFCIIERYPISKNINFLDFFLKKFEKKNKKSNFQIKIQKFLLFLANKMDKKYKFLNIFLDFENIYNILYLIITIISYNSPLFYSVLLIDLLKRSKTLQEILGVLYNNGLKILKLIFFGICLLFMFSVIFFLKFSKLNKYNTKKEKTLVISFTESIFLGLLKKMKVFNWNFQLENDEYWDFYFYQFSFFIIISCLLLVLILGIIVEGFKELRENKNKLRNNIKNKCFICGINKEIFDRFSNGWLEHIYLEHNVYHYLNFLIYVKNKPAEEYNEIEKYVFLNYNARKLDFFPIERSLILEKKQ